jgi:hypothetical protein
MAIDDASSWLERHADLLRRSEQVKNVTVRELRPQQRDPVWLMHVALGSGGSGDWNLLLGDLVRGLHRLGMQPTVCIDERLREAVPAAPELLPAA